MLARAILPNGDIWQYAYDMFARRLSKKDPVGKYALFGMEK